MTDVSVAGRSELERERDFLLGSIADLDREHAAGDLSEADYESLRVDYVRRAAACLRSIEELEHVTAQEPAPAPRSRLQRARRALGRRRIRRVLGVGATVCFLVVAGLLAAHLAGVRLPGESATGTVTQSEAATVAEDLDQAAVYGNEGQVTDAVLLYDAVLAKLPDQPTALTYGGWLTRLSGLSAHSSATVKAGDDEIAKAARIDPTYADAEALYGVVLYRDLHDPKTSLACFERFLQDNPGTALTASVAPEARAVYAEERQPLPKAFAPS